MTEIELHARKKQSQELNQLDVLEHESFCAWTLWLSLWEWAWVWVGLGTELVESFIKQIYKEFPRLPTLAFKRRPFYPTLTEAWSSGETEQALTWGIRHSRGGGYYSMYVGSECNLCVEGDFLAPAYHLVGKHC